MGLNPTIQGFKGGGSAHTPVEAPDTLRSISYFQIEEILAEGEIGGLVNGLQSVKLDGTPVENADGTLNFTGVSVQNRSGTQDQSYIPGYGSVKNEIAVSTELKSDTPWVRALSNTELSAISITLQVDALQKSNTSNGDINGYRIQYAIDISTDGGAYNTVLNGAFDGKASNPYQRTHRIDLPTASLGWNVRVRRITANANSATVADTTRVISITEIIDAKLRMPNTAYVAISGDASQFSNIPIRSYVCWGRLIRVPSNYDPQTRAYSGVWDGSFKIAWTNNPAWILYDIVLNDRFGLGAMVDASLMDKWELYRIAQYCDQLVPDGKGGQEPRYTCTCYLQTREDAFRLLGDLASVFSGVSYWMGSAITTVADMPDDPVYTYTAANVIDGAFSYQSSARKTRYTTALVTYNDPENSYKQAVEYVPDDAAIARYGIQPYEFVAFGCTRQSQAHRRGLWAVTSSQYETDSVTFAVGLEGLRAAPGQIIRVQDPARAGARNGGRVSAASASTVTVDRAPEQVAIGDTLTVHLPEGTAQSRVINGINGRVLSVSQPFTEIPVGQSVWAVESTTLQNQTFRILSVSEDSSEGQIKFTISAVQHNASKFAHIDSGAAIQVPPISGLPASLQKPPTNVTLEGRVVVEQGIANNVMTIEWTAAEGAATYKVEWQKDNGQWIQAGTVPTTSLDVIGIYTGTYIARVTAINNGNVASIAAYSDPTLVAGKTGAPPSLATLTAKGLPFGIALDWTFPPNTEDSQRTEIWSSATAARPDAEVTAATKMGDFSYPGSHTELHGLAAGASLFFWGRIVDKAGNIGPFYPPTGAVNGQSISDPNQLQDYWAGTIGKGALQDDLLSEIDASTAAVGQLTDDVADLNAAATQLRTDVDAAASSIQQETDDRVAAISAEAQARADAIAAEAQARGAAVTSEATARQTADESLSSRIDTVTAAAGGNTAAIQAEATARANADSAEVTARQTLSSKLTGLTDPSNASLGDLTSGIIFDEKKARTDADGALSTSISLVQGQANDNAAAITAEQTARASANQALGTRVDTVTASFGAVGRWTSVYQVNTATPKKLANADGTTPLDKNAPGGAVYECEAQVKTTSSVTSAVAQFISDGTNWTLKKVYERGVTSNNPEFFIDADGVPALRLYNHTSVYSVQVITTKHNTQQTSGTVNAAAITSEATARATADTAMAQDIALIGAHNAAKSAFILNQQTTQVDATTTLAQWMTSVTAANGDVSTRLNTEVTARTNGDTALGTRIENLSSTVGQNTAAITAEQQARADGDSANASAIQTLQVSAGNVFRDVFDAADPKVRWKKAGGTGSTYVDVASADSLVGGQVMRIGDGTTDNHILLWATDRIPFDPNKLYRVRARVRRVQGDLPTYIGIAAFAADKVTHVTTSGSSSNTPAHYTGLTPAIGTFVEYTGYFKGRAATGVSPMNRTFDNPAPLNNGAVYFAPVIYSNYSSGLGIVEIDYFVIEDAEAIGTGLANTAAITAEAQARADADSALASRTTAIEASVTMPVKAGADSTPAGANTRKAGIYTYSVARVDGDLAEAIKTEALSATVGGYSAQIQTVAQAQATTDGKVSSSYTIKTQVAANGQRYMAGIALGVDYSGGDVTSQVLVNAGTFAVINATDGSAPTTYPFVIQGGQVFISQALIGQGWIQDAMIGNTIRSTANDSTGNPLWVLDKTSGLMMRGSGAGWRTERDGTGARLYDGNGTLRFRWGAW